MRIGTTSYRNIQNGPQTLQGVRETAIVKPIGEGMKLKLARQTGIPGLCCTQFHICTPIINRMNNHLSTIDPVGKLLFREKKSILVT